MLPTKPPTRQELELAQDIVRRYGQAHAKSIARRIAQVQKRADKDHAIIDECNQLTGQLYTEVMEALPDEHSKELFMTYSFLASAEHTLRRLTLDETKLAHRLFVQSIKQAKKLLGMR
jgi:hypothetical protein